MRGLSICQDPHIHPLSASSGQRINENVYSLNTAKQVTMRCGFSCYRVFYCFLTPSFVLLGASAKSRCLGKLSHPALLSRQVKTVIFIYKITITTVKSPILHFDLMRTHKPPIVQKRAKLLSLGMSQPYICIPLASVHKELLFGSAVHIILAQNLR